MIEKLEKYFESIKTLSIDEQVEIFNNIKLKMKEYSPFKNEPVDTVLWVKNDLVVANDYNPNKVAPPEMQLLEVSIYNDGYTQPVVTCPENGNYTVIDGFHRTRVSKESEQIKSRIFGYTPVTIIKDSQNTRNDRIASTIRHNRARGKHTIDAMSEIVLELKNRNWRNDRIARELGMDEDEILRLCQISGLEDIFKDDDFSKSWNVEDSCEDGNEYEPLTDKILDAEKQMHLFRTVNTSDPDRIFHTFDKWECQKFGFYKSCKEDMTSEECEQKAAELLSNSELFSTVLNKVISNWKYSCEHYLTNKSMNRIAWLGQAACCYELGIPSKFTATAWSLLTKEQQDKANEVALVYLNKWLSKHSLNLLSMEDAISIGRQVEIY